MSDARRPHRQFPSANKGLVDGERKEKIGFSKGVVVEEVMRAGAEGVGVERPSAKRDGDAELMLFVALAMERNESATTCRAQIRSEEHTSEFQSRLIVVT